MIALSEAAFRQLFWDLSFRSRRLLCPCEPLIRLIWLAWPESLSFESKCRGALSLRLLNHWAALGKQGLHDIFLLYNAAIYNIVIVCSWTHAVGPTTIWISWRELKEGIRKILLSSHCTDFSERMQGRRWTNWSEAANRLCFSLGVPGS
jgi:hypothetical protein